MNSPAPNYRRDTPNETFPRTPGDAGAGYRADQYRDDDLHRDDYRAEHRSEYGTTRADSHTIGALLKQLARDVPDLVVKELALARAEVSENLRETKAGVASMASGGGVLLAGLVVLLMSAVYALSNVLAPWLSALIVGGIVTLIGFGMVAGGKKKLEAGSMKPDRTMNQMHKDKQAIRSQTQGRTS